MPLGEITRFDDAVFGPQEVASEEIEDFVLLRSPKTDAPDSALPTYQLGAVVDDIDMRITHVIRGADHISNTPKQVLLYRALGAPLPVFAHVPLILGPDRTRLSKRHGATSVGSYRRKDFCPRRFVISWLCWAGPRATTPSSCAPANWSQRFSLAGVSRTNAVFDRAKLEWFDQQYLQKLPIDELLPALEGELKRSGLWRDEWAGRERDWFARTVDLLRTRTRLLPISPLGREPFSPTIFPTIPRPSRNSGRTSACPHCWRN